MTNPHFLQPDHAPTPFTADQIRRGCPKGRVVTTETTTAEGVVTATTEFVSTSPEGAVVKGPRGEAEVTWHQLQSHASFPADQTEITRELITIPVGELECNVYNVRRGEETHRFWFAESKPGMPVMMTVESDGQIVSQTKMISDVLVTGGQSEPIKT